MVFRLFSQLSAPFYLQTFEINSELSKLFIEDCYYINVCMIIPNVCWLEDAFKQV